MENSEHLRRIGPNPRGLTKTGGRSEPRKILERVFVGKLGDDFLAVAKGEFTSADMDALLALAYEMHLDPALCFIVNRAMCPPRKIEVRAQLPVRPRQQIQIELRSDAGAVVVGRFQNFAALLQIDPDDEAAVSSA